MTRTCPFSLLVLLPAATQIVALTSVEEAATSLGADSEEAAPVTGEDWKAKDED